MAPTGILVEGYAAPWGHQEVGAGLLIVTGNMKADIALNQLGVSSRTPSSSLDTKPSGTVIPSAVCPRLLMNPSTYFKSVPNITPRKVCVLRKHYCTELLEEVHTKTNLFTFSTHTGISKYVLLKRNLASLILVISLCGHVQVSAGPCRDYRHEVLLELKFQAVVSYLAQVLGTRLGSSANMASTHNH